MKSDSEHLMHDLRGHHTLIYSALYLLKGEATELEEAGLQDMLVRAINNTQAVLKAIQSRRREDPALYQEALEEISRLQAYLKSNEGLARGQTQAQIDRFRLALAAVKRD